MIKRRMKQLLVIVKIVITVLFVYVVNKTIFNTDEPLVGLVPVDILIVSILFSIVSTLLQGYRWFIFLRIFGMKASFFSAMRSYLEGVLFAVVTPGRAGELLRGYSLKKEWLKMSSIAVAVERLWATVVLFLVALAAFPFLPGDKGGNIYSKAVVVVGVLSFAAVFVIPHIVKKYRNSARKVRRGFLTTFLLSLIIQILLVTQISLMVVGRLPISFQESTAAISSALCGMQFMPITVANMGVREFNLTYFISLFISSDVSKEIITHVVLSTSLLMIIANLLFPAIPGVFVLLLTRITGSDRRK